MMARNRFSPGLRRAIRQRAAWGLREEVIARSLGLDLEDVGRVLGTAPGERVAPRPENPTARRSIADFHAVHGKYGGA